MAVVQSLGEIAALQPPNWWGPASRTAVTFFDQFNYDYATLYRTQPNVRTCVDFLARNIAQLGLHVFKRQGENDRQRLRDHGLPLLLAQPLPPEMKMTTYRLFESLVADLGIYFNAYWLKIRREGTVGALLRLPPMYVNPKGGLFVTSYKLNIAGREFDIDPKDMVHFRGYNPESAITGLSPLETLRQILAEEHSANQYREEFWRNSARMTGIVRRPLEAPEWSDTARQRFLEEFNQLYQGAGAEAGGTAVLEDGMEWTPGSFNPRESEYTLGRKLTREECARSYHIPLPMVGILDNATFSNIKEQHKNLYQDCLGPQLAAIEDDIELQLLPEFADTDGVYVEFNIAEKLQGAFEEQVTALSQATGRPWMTANEARARINLPKRTEAGADELVVPLNVQLGDTVPEEPEPPANPPGAPPKAKRYNPTLPALRARHREQWARALARHYRRQEAAMVSRVPKAHAVAGNGHSKAVIGGVWYDEDRWNDELTADLLRLNRNTSLEWAKIVQDQAGVSIEDPDAFEARMLPWLAEHSRVQAEGINGQVRDGLEEALGQPDALEAVKHLFELAITVWAVKEAVGAVTAAANFGSTEMAQAGGLRSKTWRVNSSNPRPSHAAMDGMRIGLRDLFPTGQKWPGDPAGGAEENSNCQCSVEFD